MVVAVTLEWTLWTSGYGRCGQLGHGTTDNCPIPRTVLDLCGSEVGQVACGRGHTLVYIPSQGHVYAFDQGLSGQPGTKTPHSRELPQVVVCPWLSPGGASLLDYAEEDSPSVCLRQCLEVPIISEVYESRNGSPEYDFYPRSSLQRSAYSCSDRCSFLNPGRSYCIDPRGSPRPHIHVLHAHAHADHQGDAEHELSDFEKENLLFAFPQPSVSCFRRQESRLLYTE
ncbi:uncharacterized protein LOC135115314 isoform X3 [Scylla paramamosain]|uniref:uncharacterized protein LOC135115314 isoform X3 n=1 Tax=Scylla paramamosain TaxID=85552 RepID=UPI0030831282